MEACPRLPALTFDFKISTHSVNLCEKIPQYIVLHYQENSANFTNECEQINRLRQNAVYGSMDESSIQYLKRYYCQLLLLRNRFPMLPDTECAVRFTWEDAFQKEENTFNDIRFEESSVLYNLGCVYSRLGVNETRKTHESMKNACTYFRCAAACFEKLRDQYTTYSVDLTPDLLTCQVHILLGQAHEAVLEKSLLDQRPPSVNAHVAMQISEYYQMALTNLLKPDIDSIISKQFRAWRVALTYKLSYYLSLAYYCCGLLADENKKRGEAVCYYENAVEQLKEAWKNASKLSTDKTSIYKDTHAYTLELISEKCKIGKRDNDSVYFEKVPALSSLPAIQGAIVAKPQPFDCHDSNVSGVDIFQKLIPMDAHLAVSEYSEEKAKLVRGIVELIDEKNRELETFLLCLQLDQIPLNNEYLRLPRELLDCYAATATRPNMSKDLVSAMQQLNSHHHDVAEQIAECEQLLQTVEQNYEMLKSSETLKDIQIHLRTMNNVMLQANESNVDLHRHMTRIIEHFKLLHLPLKQFEDQLPKIAELDDETIKSKLARLGLLYEKLETMRKQRDTLLNDFRRKVQEDDITKHVVMQRQENHKALFAGQMKKHDELINIIKQNCRAQENILQSMTEANADIADVRTKIISTFESRRRLIQDFINSFHSFDETLAKASEGIEFYKKQTDKLKILHQRLTTLQSQQQTQHSSPPNPPCDRSQVSDRPRLKDYLAAMKPDTWGSTAPNRPSTKVDESIYIPPSMLNINSNNTLYAHPVPPASSPPSNVPNLAGNTLAPLTNYNPQPYQVQSTFYPQSSSISFVPPSVQTSQATPSFAAHHAVPYQQTKCTASNAMEHNFPNQSHMSYAPSTHQSFYQQQFYPSQSMYPSYPCQLPMYQPAPVPQPMSHPFLSAVPNPSMYSSNDAHRSNQTPLPVAPKFDPYRPQPVGAYDIPKQSLPNPQDVYRPGGLLGISATVNENSYEQNQYVPASAFANLSINSMLNH